MFEYKHIDEGGKLAKTLLRHCSSEDPRVAVIAAATTLVAACKATTISRSQLHMLLDRITNVYDGDARAAAQGALDALF